MEPRGPRTSLWIRDFIFYFILFFGLEILEIRPFASQLPFPSGATTESLQVQQAPRLCLT